MDEECRQRSVHDETGFLVRGQSSLSTRPYGRMVPLPSLNTRLSESAVMCREQCSKVNLVVFLCKTPARTLSVRELPHLREENFVFVICHHEIYPLSYIEKNYKRLQFILFDILVLGI